MKGLVAILLVCALALAGCVGTDLAPEGPEADEGAAPAWVAPVLSIESMEVVPGGVGNGGEVTVSWTVNGGVDKEAWVETSLDVLYGGTGASASDVNGAAFNGSFALASSEFTLHPGSHRVIVAATLMDEDGQPIFSYEGDRPEPWTHQVLDVSVPAQATVTIDYGSTSDKDPVNDTVWVDIVDYPSQSQYDDEGVKHPEYANVHDVMVAWEEQSGHKVAYSYDSGFASFSIDRIDGEGNALSAGEPPWWCYQVNGEYASQGISPQRFEPGDAIAWDLGDCNGAMGAT